jgi:hypothetical protein
MTKILVETCSNVIWINRNQLNDCPVGYCVLICSIKNVAVGLLYIQLHTKNTVFWNGTPYCFVNRYLNFGVICCGVLTVQISAHIRSSMLVPEYLYSSVKS